MIYFSSELKKTKKLWDQDVSYVRGRYKVVSPGCDRGS